MALPSLDGEICEETAPSIMGRIMNAHTVTKANEAINGTVAVNDSNETKQKLQPLLKSVILLTSDTKSNIKRILADLSVLTRTDFEVIVKYRLTGRNNK